MRWRQVSDWLSGFRIATAGCRPSAAVGGRCHSTAAGRDLTAHALRAARMQFGRQCWTSRTATVIECRSRVPRPRAAARRLLAAALVRQPARAGRHQPRLRHGPRARGVPRSRADGFAGVSTRGRVPAVGAERRRRLGRGEGLPVERRGNGARGGGAGGSGEPGA